MTPAERVLRFLSASTPYTLATISVFTALPRRAVEEAVQELRLAGHPIISDKDGIRLSADPAEVLACSERLRHRLVTQYLTLRSLRRTARRMAAEQAAREAPPLAFAWGDAA